MYAQSQIEETSFSFSQQVPSPPERRQHDRDNKILKILRVGVLVIDSRRELCLIRNISAGGLMAHVYSPVRLDQRVAVEIRTNQQVEGRVAWVNESNCGVAFDELVDIAELLANPPTLDNGWRSRPPRIEIDRLATVRAGARTYWVHARDISQGGAKIETDQPIETGTNVVLTLEGFRPVPGVVRWQAGSACGIAFNDLIPLADLIGWLRRDD